MPSSLTWIVVAIIAFAAWNFWTKRHQIPGEEAKKLVSDGALLVDVRTDGEFAAGHLETAKNIPLHSLGGRLSELPKNRSIVLYCQSGARSARAASILKGAGFEKVYDLGGMSRW
jgi:phage shock protein E